MAKHIVGHCTPDACGSVCCKILLIPVVGFSFTEPIAGQGGLFQAALPFNSWDDDYLDARGARVTGKLFQLDNVRTYRLIHGKGPFAHALLGHTCPHLTDTGRCDLHGTEAKPLACREFPLPQVDFDLIPGCGYRAEDDDA